MIENNAHQYWDMENFIQIPKNYAYSDLRVRPGKTG